MTCNLFYRKSFYFNLKSEAEPEVLAKPSAKVCVKQCPNETIWLLSGLKEMYEERDINLCRYDITPDNMTADGEVCPSLPVVEQLV